jgi:hypothetical protein
MARRCRRLSRRNCCRTKKRPDGEARSAERATALGSSVSLRLDGEAHDASGARIRNPAETLATEWARHAGVRESRRGRPLGFGHGRITLEISRTRPDGFAGGAGNELLRYAPVAVGSADIEACDRPDAGQARIGDAPRSGENRRNPHAVHSCTSRPACRHRTRGCPWRGHSPPGREIPACCPHPCARSNRRRGSGRANTCTSSRRTRRSLRTGARSGRSPMARRAWS